MTLVRRAVWLAVAATVGCHPTATAFRGSITSTLTAGPGAGVGSHGGSVAPSEAHVCWWSSLRGGLSVELGHECRLTSSWTWNRNYAGGGGAIGEHERCSLLVGDTRITLTTSSGTITQTTDRGPMDVTVDGTTADGRYVSLRFSGAAVSFEEDPWCTELRASSPPP